MILKTMKLNEDGKSEIRKLIEDELGLVSNARKIKLDKDLLEELLFYKIKYDKDKYIKLPIWSGSFLSKIDLSEVDYSDVSFAILYDIYVDSNRDDFIYNLVKEKVSKYIRGSIIYYGSTNANIDFKKTFEYKHTGKVIIHGVNFNKADLSNNDINSEFDIIHGYFANTNLNISTIRDTSMAQSSDFTGIDLSYYEVDASDIDQNRLAFKNNCILKDTRMNINLSIENYEQMNAFWDKYYNGDFIGCRINNVLVKSDEKRRQDMLILRKKYNTEVEELKDHVKKIIKPYKII